ncbi:hypothetical protein HQ587_04830 [bacterium]|nr:hypothetical protein [bacterium]
MNVTKKHLALDFEDFLKCEMPHLLNLSPSKQVATKYIFDHFADCLRSLEKSDKENMFLFVSAFCERLRKISKWRSPRGYKVIPKFTQDGIAKTSDGKTVYELGKKPDDIPEL